MAIFLLFGVFGMITYNEVEKLQGDIKVSNQHAARQELLFVIKNLTMDVKGHAHDFASWEEVGQQINNPLYYAYWYNHRALQAGILPDYTLDVAIYDLSGRALSKLDKNTLPNSINTQNISSYVDIYDDKLELVEYAKVESGMDNKSTIGYVGIRFNIIPELTDASQFNYIDRQTLKPNLHQRQRLPVSELVNQISFGLRPNTEINRIMDIVVSMLGRMALIIGVPTLLLYPLVTYLVARPLMRISQYIDHLKDNNAGEELSDFGHFLAVSELKKVSDSLNKYHKQLFDVHTSLDDKNKELWNLAHHDALTGTFNRRAFDDHWRNLTSVFSGGRMEICLAIFDINNFKAFNDTYGHQIGDEVLKDVSDTIMKVLRKGEGLYRLGGDEFACVFINCSKGEAMLIAERCEKEVAELSFTGKGISEPVRISIGVAHGGEDDTMDLSALQWQADMAMYSAKIPGKSHIAFYNEGMKSGFKGLLSSHINNIVYEAITAGTGIQMYYQPVVNLNDRTPAYFEALVRIYRDDKIIMPDDIFQLVEARRLEVEIDKVILQKIYMDIEQGIIPHGTGVSVNVSGVSIVHQGIINQLEQFRCFLNDYKIVLEITETALITQIEEAAENLTYLRSLGFLIALDDFGSGYSSVRYLASMPVDIVKFDITLIRCLNDSSQNTIVKHLASLISEMGHKLVAEGIETEELLNKVIELEFSHGQGYLFGKPQAEPDINIES